MAERKDYTYGDRALDRMAPEPASTPTGERHQSNGELCSLHASDGASFPGTLATHKVGEEHGTPVGMLGHNYTNYLCCACFGRVMGLVAARDCAVPAERPAEGTEDEREQVENTLTEIPRYDPFGNATTDQWERDVEAIVSLIQRERDAALREEWAKRRVVELKHRGPPR